MHVDFKNINQQLIVAGMSDGDAGEGEETGESAPILDAEELLTEISELFSAYQDAVAEGRWQEAGEIMERIQDLLQ